MAQDDIRPYQSPHGGHDLVMHFGITAATTFLRGEPVGVVAAGTLTEYGDDAALGGLMGISAAGGDTTAATGSVDWRTGVVIAALAPVPVIMPSPHTYFRTRNFGTTSEQFDEDLVVANLGDEAGLELVAGTWGINVGATVNTCRVMDLLDADGVSIRISGGTAVECVFVILTGMNMDTAEVPAPV